MLLARRSLRILYHGVVLQICIGNLSTTCTTVQPVSPSEDRLSRIKIIYRTTGIICHVSDRRWFPKPQRSCVVEIIWAYILKILNRLSKGPSVLTKVSPANNNWINRSIFHICGARTSPACKKLRNVIWPTFRKISEWLLSLNFSTIAFSYVSGHYVYGQLFSLEGLPEMVSSHYRCSFSP